MPPTDHSTPQARTLENASQLIRNRRTIKPAAMADEELPVDLLETLLENANWAPTHGLTEPWRFKVFRGAARARLADTLKLC